ncbi:MAG: T9SS type A sorting domain-containing protein [Muribaculaceae bacterium]|nr:T9SS type A sorting domain-containing protein [Muribaculaceae bacterium]
MKRNRIIELGWLMGSLSLCCSCPAIAADTVPCLIFTGKSDTERCIDLAKLNRVTFGEDGMTVSSSKNTGEPDVSLMYSLFNRLKIGNVTPIVSTEIGAVEAADEVTRLRFQVVTKSLVVESASDESYSIAIFSLKGALIATSKIHAGQFLSVEALPTGVYVAVASNEESKLSLKFIIKQ